MTQLSPTPLEEAAKAMHGAEPWSYFWSTGDARLLATAAITSYLEGLQHGHAIATEKQDPSSLLEGSPAAFPEFHF